MKIHCLIVDDEPLARKLIRSYAERVTDLTVVAECSSALEAMSALQKDKIDLIFLDIQMPELDGMSFIRTIPHPPEVIFTTAFREFGADAFDLNAIDYLIKPIAFDRFLTAMNKYTERYNTGILPTDNPAGWFYVTSNRKQVRVEINQIVLVESLDDHVKIHLRNTSIQTRETISSIGTHLPSKDFVRIHRSFIVPISAIQNVSGEGIQIVNRFLPFGRSYRLQAMAALGLR